MADEIAPGELIDIYLATGAPLTTVSTDGLRAVFDAGRASTPTFDRDAIAEAIGASLEVRMTSRVFYAPMRGHYLSAADAVIALLTGKDN